MKLGTRPGAPGASEMPENRAERRETLSPGGE